MTVQVKHICRQVMLININKIEINEIINLWMKLRFQIHFGQRDCVQFYGR